MNRLPLVSRALLACVLFSCFSLRPRARPTQPEPPLRGFTPAAAAAQQEVEKQFLAIPSAEEARRWHRYLTAEPHPAGSARNNELAEYIAEQWKQQGWEEVIIHRYDVLNTFPKEVRVELIAPVSYTATLREDSYDADPDSANSAVQSGYLGLSASGEVTAPLVYANSGNPADYALLKKHGIRVKGKIVLVRYSNPYSYRGFKAFTAQREGAAAMLIYSDPQEDGYVKGKVFPEGPWGPESHIQRGAITYDFIVPGDPLTPGWASTPGAKRVAMEQAASVPKIIAVPMSWRDAKPLLENMGGPMAPKEWQGGLPLKYRLGGNAARVHVKVEMDNRVMSNYVVEGRIRGSEHPDEWVILGNHRDAWEFGGVDPSSGTASLLEVTRTLGEMKKRDTRPRRTIVVCSWDGEEVALTGSTEWGEQFAEELKKKAVAYLNVDTSASGPNFSAMVSGSVGPLVVEIARTLTDPGGKTLYQAWKESATRAQESTLYVSRAASSSDEDLPNTRIGSGSDHTVFLNHLGIPVFDFSFTGPYGVYHSVYDSHYWVSQFGDPGFRYHVLTSQLWGVTALRLANADVLSFDFAAYARRIRQFAGDVEKISQKAGRLDLRPLMRATVEFQSAARALHHEVEQQLSLGRRDAARASVLNARLRQVEQNFLHSDGLPGRPWFKHLIYACRYTYAHLELPGLTEAAEAGRWKQAQEQAERVTAALRKNAALLQVALAEYHIPKARPPAKSAEGRPR